jgi:hypothetical protein
VQEYGDDRRVMSLADIRDQGMDDAAMARNLAPLVVTKHLGDGAAEIAANLPDPTGRLKVAAYSWKVTQDVGKLVNNEISGGPSPVSAGTMLVGQGDAEKLFNSVTGSDSKVFSNSSKMGYGLRSAQNIADGKYADGVVDAMKAAGDVVPKKLVTGVAAGNYGVKAGGAVMDGWRAHQDISNIEQAGNRAIAAQDAVARGLEEKAGRFDGYADMLEAGRDPNADATLQAIREQFPGLDGEMADVTDAMVANFERDTKGLFPTSKTEGSVPNPGAKSRVWFDPKDKNGFVNVIDAQGRYHRMPLAQAIAGGHIPAGTTVQDLTHYNNQADRFENDLDTSDRHRDRLTSIEQTHYPEGRAVAPGETRERDVDSILSEMRRRGGSGARGDDDPDGSRTAGGQGPDAGSSGAGSRIASLLPNLRASLERIEAAISVVRQNLS